MNASSHQPPAYILWIILANFFFLFFFTSGSLAQLRMPFYCTLNAAGWTPQSWFINLPSTYLVYCSQAVFGFTVHVSLSIWCQMVSIAINQAGYFSRTVCFFMVIGWTFALLLPHLSAGHLILFPLSDLIPQYSAARMWRFTSSACWRDSRTYLFVWICHCWALFKLGLKRKQWNEGPKLCSQTYRTTMLYGFWISSFFFLHQVMQSVEKEFVVFATGNSLYL